MKYKLICCEVFMRIACMEIANARHIIDPEFTKLGAHEDPNNLRKSIQNIIDSVEKQGGYDAILLCYGLCGNATVNLKARSIPLIIPRAHDCCTIFLGSRDKFIENFKDRLSSSWSSVCYMERSNDYLRETDTGKILGIDRDFQELVEQYGEENAQYIWDTLHPDIKQDELIYINTPELKDLGHLEEFKEIARKKDMKVNILEGDNRLIHQLISGNWNENDFLIVLPGGETKAVYDHEIIIEAEYN